MSISKTFAPVRHLFGGKKQGFNSLQNSLADYWDQTEPVEFEIASPACSRYFIPVDKDLLNRVHQVARIRGLSTETLANLLLEQ